MAKIGLTWIFDMEIKALMDTATEYIQTLFPENKVNMFTVDMYGNIPYIAMEERVLMEDPLAPILLSWNHADVPYQWSLHVKDALGNSYKLPVTDKGLVQIGGDDVDWALFI